MPREMPHYRSNAWDIVLDLFELLDSTAVYGADPFAVVDTEVALSAASRTPWARSSGAWLSGSATGGGWSPWR
jgi:hypothetical protein